MKIVSINVFLLPFQIWDFQLGATRDCAEPGPKEAGDNAKDPGLRIKNYDNLTEEAAFNTRKLSEDIYELNFSTPSENIRSRDVSHSIFSNFKRFVCWGHL